MWNLRKEQLKGPLAFYKIGHHGSVNATPWGMTPAASKGEPLAILDAILPEKSKANAKAIVSTRRGNYETIPRTDLLAEIGKRVSNTRNYAAAFKKAGKKTSEVPKFGEFEKKSFDEAAAVAHRPRTHAAGIRRDSSTSRSKPDESRPMARVHAIASRCRARINSSSMTAMLSAFHASPLAKAAP